MPPEKEHRAAPPQAPAPSADLLCARAEQQQQHAQRAVIARRSMVRGLLLLAFIMLIASMVRAGFDRVFVQGWWRHW